MPNPKSSNEPDHTRMPQGATPPKARARILQRFNERKIAQRAAEDPHAVAARVLKLADRPKITLDTYKPNRVQAKWHADGAIHRERLLKAGNQLGKTTAGGIEMAAHLTGRYPAWWAGRRFTHPVRAWASSVSHEATRDNVQRILLGEPKDRANWGSGMIPKRDLLRWTTRAGVKDAIDGVLVRHISGGTSTLGFKSFDQGREKWQGETLDIVWFDEEPPIDIYWEGLTRTNATDGLVYLTLTPLKGMSEVMMLFADCPGFWPDGYDKPLVLPVKAGGEAKP